MVITQAPLRISFAGGGTDIEPYCSEYGSLIIAASVKIYAHAQYPSANHDSNDLERIILWYFEGTPGALTITNDAPPKAGLGGSASCFVAGVKALNPKLDTTTIAELAFWLERDKLGIAGGKQDQYMAAFGGFNKLNFGKKTAHIKRLTIPPGLQSSLVLVYLGQRKANGHDIIKDQMKRNYVPAFNRQKDIASQMIVALRKNNLWDFGFLLDEAWQSKLEFSPYIATSEIKDFYKKALTMGAIGGKLTGAGGGGFMLLMESPAKPGYLHWGLSSRKIPFIPVEFEEKGVHVC